MHLRGRAAAVSLPLYPPYVSLAVSPVRSCVSSPALRERTFTLVLPRRNAGVRAVCMAPLTPAPSSCSTFNGEASADRGAAPGVNGGGGVKTAQHGAATPYSKRAETHNTRVTCRDDTCSSHPTEHRERARRLATFAGHVNGVPSTPTIHI